MKHALEKSSLAISLSWQAVLIFLLSLFIFFLLTPHIVAELDLPRGDEPYYLLIAHSLLYDHDIEMSNNYAQKDYWSYYPEELLPHRSQTKRPGWYEKHSIGLPLLISPAYALGSRLGTVLWLNVLAALLSANIFLLAREVTGKTFPALSTWLATVFTNPLFSYSFLIFPALPATLLVTYAYRRSRLATGNAAWQTFLVSICLAFLPWLHPRFLLIVLPLGAFFLFKRHYRWPALLLFIIPLFLSGILLMSYYYYLYGTIVPNYHDHAGAQGVLGTINGLFGSFLDQQWGLLVYSPIYMLLFAGLVRLWKERRSELFWIAVIGLPYLLFIANYHLWWGEWCPPARYLVPLTPLFVVGIASAIASIRARTFNIIAVILLMLSLGIMGIFLWHPKLMYNHPTGQSVLLLWADQYLDHVELSGLFPSFVVLSLRTYPLALPWLAAIAYLIFLSWDRLSPQRQATQL
ncbi:MAG: hypothetical protein M1136_06840 [Chloroflexi bacterium]|nr:hypothetical protein [Chloroflexota bacterium]MCL5075349.1 hypothetical protein [Chloroflexota bacterium]